MRLREIIIILTVMLILFFSPFVIIWMTSKNNGGSDYQETIDSLNGEISTLQIDNGRYQIILERVNKLDSNVYNQAIKNIE